MEDDRYRANMLRFETTGDSNDLDPRIGFGRRRDRLISEILGMFRMSLHDGVISESEALTMHEWIAANPTRRMCTSEATQRTIGSCVR